MAATTSTANSNTDRQKRIDELTNEINKKVSSSKDLTKQSSSIESQIVALKAEEQYLSGQISKNSSDQAAIEENIKNTESLLENQRALLGTIMANMYVDDAISPLEMLASSGSVADYIDAQEMRQSMESELTRSIGSVKQAEAQLRADKETLQRIAGDQANQKLALDQRQAEQSQLLTATVSQTGQLEQVSAEMAQERKQLQDQQQQSMVASMGGATRVTTGSISQPTSQPVPPSVPAPAPGNPTPAPTPQPSPSPPVVLPNGGYPSYLQNCFVDANALSYGIDPWGYGCRQCVSYTAWKVLQKTGRPAMYWGNAKQWPASAARVGIPSGSQPREQSVAVMTSGPYGHVAWVESINPNGTLNVSQYNYWLPGTSNGGWGWYSEFRNVSPRTYQAYIYV